MFQAFYVNRGRNSEYSNVRNTKKLEMGFLNISWHRQSFSNFSGNNGEVFCFLYIPKDEQLL